MTSISAFRMLGRFDYAIGLLMEKYYISIQGEAPDYPVMLTELSKIVDGEDINFCLRMAEASKIFEEETRLSSLSQEQAKQESEIGFQEAASIYQKAEQDFPHKIFERKDFISEFRREEERQKKEKLRNILVGIGIIAVIVGSIVIYNLPYFSERRAFSKVMKMYESESVDMLGEAVAEYSSKYPDGKHFSEVMYMPVKFAKSNNDVILTLDAVENYLQADPAGPYAKECEALSDSIWNVEINKYKASVAVQGATKGTDFVLDMLQYMKNNSMRIVNVVGFPQLDLKEYSEYPAEMRRLMESLPSDPVKGMLPGTEPKLPDDMVTITDKIQYGEAREWTSYVVSALQNGFDKVLTPGFIVFQKTNSNETSASRCPIVEVNYTVYNQETLGFPEVWIHTRSDELRVYSANLFLGIAMTLDADFRLPGENISYIVSGSGDAGDDEIKNVDQRQVYARMCERITQQFADKIAKEFGLEQVTDDSNQ